MRAEVSNRKKNREKTWIIKTMKTQELSNRKIWHTLFTKPKQMRSNIILFFHRSPDYCRCCDCCNNDHTPIIWSGCDRAHLVTSTHTSYLHSQLLSSSSLTSIFSSPSIAILIWLRNNMPLCNPSMDWYSPFLFFSCFCPYFFHLLRHSPP